MKRSEPIGHFVIAAIDRECVLHEVVGPQFEEIDGTRNVVGKHHGRWHLYHGTNEDGKNLRKDLTTEQKEDNRKVELYAQVLIMSILKSRRITLMKEDGKPVLDIPSTTNSGHTGRNKEEQNKW